MRGIHPSQRLGLWLLLGAVFMIAIMGWTHSKDLVLMISKPGFTRDHEDVTAQDSKEFRSEDATEHFTKCSTADRVGHLEGICSTTNQYPELSRWHHSREALYNMSDKELRAVVRNIIVDDEHKVLFCAIAKTGSTSWLYHFVKNTNYYLQNRDGTNFTHRGVHTTRYLNKFGLVNLRDMSRNDIFLRLDNYYSMINVRHPLDRLVSTYNEKFVKENKMYQQGAGRRIIKRYRENPSNDSLRTGVGVTFSEYLHMVRDDHRKNMFIDWHWENYYKSCFPCLIRYDYIAKIETSDEDIDYIIRHKLSGNVVDETLNDQRGGGRAFEDSVKVLENYRDVSWELFRDVLVFYHADMDMFGYSAVRDVRTGEVTARCGHAEGGCC